jgi:hypothetical protein
LIVDEHNSDKSKPAQKASDRLQSLFPDDKG